MLKKIFFTIIFITNVSSATIVTNTNDDLNPGSLRHAIATANAGDEITFDPSILPAFIQLNSEIVIDKNLTISGNPDANNIVITGDNFRAFNIGGSATNVSMSNLILDGFASALQGGAILASNSGLNLTIENIIFNGISTRCNQVGEICHGGAIAFSGDALTISRSTILNTNATCEYEGCLINGGTIFVESGDLNINASYFGNNGADCTSDNCQSFGGIISQLAGTLNSMNSIYVGNYARCFASGCLAKGGTIYTDSTVNAVELLHNMFRDSYAYCSGGTCTNSGHIFAEGAGANYDWNLSGNILHSNRQYTGDCDVADSNRIVSGGNNLQDTVDCIVATQPSDFTHKSELNYFDIFFDDSLAIFDYSAYSESPVVDHVQGTCAVTHDINGKLRPDNLCDVGPFEAEFYIWDNPTSGDFLNAGNWLINSVPTVNSRALITNGGQAVLNTVNGQSDTLHLERLQIGSYDKSGHLLVDGGISTFGTVGNPDLSNILVGSTESASFMQPGTHLMSSSSLTVQNINQFDVGGDLKVGVVYLQPNAVFDIQAELNLDNIDTVHVNDDFELGEIKSQDSPGNIQNISVQANISNINNFIVDDDFEFVAGGLDENAGAANSTVNFSMENINSLSAIELDFASSGLTTQFGTNVDITAVFKNIPDFSIWTGPNGDESAKIKNDYYHEFRNNDGFSEQNTRTNSVLFEDVNLSAKSMSLFSSNDIEDEVIINFNDTFMFVNSTFTLTGKDENNDYSLGMNYFHPYTTNNQSTVNQSLIFDASGFNGLSAIVGSSPSAAPMMNDLASIELKNASFIQFSEDMAFLPKSILTFHVDGLQRVDAKTVGNTGLYSAINANFAGVDSNTINVQFNNTFMAGMHHFDLINSQLANGIDANPDIADFLFTHNLDPGFSVDYFDKVLDGGVEKLRLTISGTPSIGDLTVSHSADNPNPGLGQIVTFTVQVQNIGFGDETNAAVSSTFGAGLQNIVWTCQAVNNSQCHTSNGVGELNNVLVDLHSGTTATFTITAEVSEIRNDISTMLTVAASGNEYITNNNSSTLIIDSDKVFNNGFED